MRRNKKVKKNKLIFIVSILIIVIVVQQFQIVNLKKKVDNNNLLTNTRISNINKTDKIMHISLDDFINAFQDITCNQDKYTSIFDNSTFAYFKELHNKYGIVLSCYCCLYNDLGDFKLSDSTTKFKKEFQENSDWLRFGFHTKDNKTNYEKSTAIEAKEDYDSVINALYNITGSYDCIDNVVRLHNFAGNLESIKAMEDSKCGIIGLLSADDERNSYYLREKDSKYIYNHDEFKDTNNDITFLNTDLRIESVSSIDTALKKVKSNEYENKANDLIVFTHEWKLDAIGIKAKLEECCEFGVENGYHFDFPEDRISVNPH